MEPAASQPSVSPHKAELTGGWWLQGPGHSFPDNSGHARRSFSGGKHNSIPFISWTSPALQVWRPLMIGFVPYGPNPICPNQITLPYPNSAG